MANDVWVYAEHSDGKLKKTSFEALGTAKTLASGLGGDLTAIIVGGTDEMVSTLGRFGAGKVYHIEGAVHETYMSEGHAAAIAALVKDKDPAVVLMGCTVQGRELGPRLAAKLETGVAPDCTELAVSDGKVVATRPVYGGKTMITCEFVSTPQVISIRPNVFPPAEEDPSASVDVEKVASSVDAASLRKVVREVVKSVSARPELTEADIIVTGGRGMGGPDSYSMLEDLADLLGAAVGASRAAVDAGWRDHSDQVGQTGKTVSPKLYIACGVSGAIQHMAGMKTSKVIVAVNKDPEAPIFNVADYGIVGNLFDVVPIMIDEVKKLEA